MPDWDCVMGMGEDGGDPDLEHHDPAGHCGASTFRAASARVVHDTPSPMDDEDEHYVTCRLCGETNLHWQSVIAADGRGENWRLFNARGRKHECPGPSADSFSVVPE